MKPIISPWFIYLLSKIDNVRNLLLLFGVLFLIYALICFLYYVLEPDEITKIKPNIHKSIKKSVIVGIILLLFDTAIPSRKTILAMYAAKFVTPNNVQMVKGEIKEAIDYIFDKVNETANIIKSSNTDK